MPSATSLPCSRGILHCSSSATLSLRCIITLARSPSQLALSSQAQFLLLLIDFATSLLSLHPKSAFYYSFLDKSVPSVSLPVSFCNPKVRFSFRAYSRSFGLPLESALSRHHQVMAKLASRQTSVCGTKDQTRNYEETFHLLLASEGKSPAPLAFSTSTP